jgi:hypothetical protein
MEISFLLSFHEIAIIDDYMLRFYTRRSMDNALLTAFPFQPIIQPAEEKPQ